eukprot:TRINITY_DN35607_c0_g1_i1.p1 TRINITY_DN35607_c0_g1~~TRINITY_DN35607_c0_g1_i1.p1  ORF type:complete len:153 (+),score=21.60 TRINITY_DN35607_c0_g1_i1:108-566(+)
MDRGSHSFFIERLLPGASATEAFDLFISAVWVGGGGLGPAPRVVAAGDETTKEGHIRAVPGGLQEEIVMSKPGEVLEYRVKSGPAPMSYHRGQVKFTSEGSAGTRVGWLVTWTPISPAWFFGPLVTFIIRFAITFMMWTLGRRAAAAQRDKK